MLFGVSILFEMHPPSINVDLVASLCTSWSRGATRMQTDPHPLVLKRVSVSEILPCLISLDEFFISLEVFSAWYLKFPAGILQ